MSRIAFQGPKLPKVILDQVGGTGSHNKHRGRPSRERRKVGGKFAHLNRTNRQAPPRKVSTKVFSSDDSLSEGDFDEPAPPVKKRKVTKEEPLKSILKPPKPLEPDSSSDIDSDDNHIDHVPVSRRNERVSSPSISRRAAKAGLEDDDAEIAALEKRLGGKGKKSDILADDELDWLVRGSDSEEEITVKGGKDARPKDDAWLRAKRQKNKEALGSSINPASKSTENSLSDTTDDSGGNLDDFDGFDSEDAESVTASPLPAKKERENPYIAPVAKEAVPVGKYIPPSLRKAAVSDEESLKHLRRQVQGQLNRLSEANMLSILQEVEKFYQNNARQHVTSTLIDLLVSLVADPAVLNDTFHILHASFATAIYKVVGTDFGAQLLEQIINTFDRHYALLSTSSESKQSLNLVSFLGYLYTYQLVGSNIVFDYVRILLDELSETNTELLLRIIRTAGQQLRQDDPSSLKEIVLQLQRSVAKSGGEAKLSVRTKFMIETINNLKNNRMKTGVIASQLASEHVTRMRKTLGVLNSRAKVSEPLRVGLADIRDSEKTGKWWLVGASYHDPSKLASNTGPDTMVKPSAIDEIDPGYESETPNNPTNLQRLARKQGMNTDIRRAIFVSILSASDYKDAHARLLKLHLKAKQELEIPRVLLHCAGAEKTYNPYYSLIAQKLCSEKRLQKAFKFSFTNILRNLEDLANMDEEEDDELSAGDWGLNKIVNLAKLYGTLVAHGGLSIAILKTLDFSLLQPNTRTFGEVLLTTVLLEANKMLARKSNDTTLTQIIQQIFEQAAIAPDMVKGLKFFMLSVVGPADIANGKTEQKIVKKGCNTAAKVLSEVAEAAPIMGKEDDEYSEGEE